MGSSRTNPEPDAQAGPELAAPGLGLIDLPPLPAPPEEVMGLLAHFTGQDSKARHLTMS